jgi:hypothetical protein
LNVLQDIVFACRVFTRQRAQIAITLAGVAFAVGVSTAVFTILNARAFRGYGVADPANVFRVDLDGDLAANVTLNGGSPMAGTWGREDFVRVTGAATSFVASASTSDGARLRESATAVDGPLLKLTAVSGNYFEVMQGNMTIGRPIVRRNHSVAMGRSDGQT